MVTLRPKLITLALFWLIAFLVCLSIYVISLFAFVRTECTILNTGSMETCERREECRFCVPVRVKLRTTGDDVRTTAKTSCAKCEGTKERYEEEFEKNEAVKCWYQKKNLKNVQLDEEGINEETVVLAPLSQLLLVVTIMFALFFLVVMIRIFHKELIRICPRFLLTVWMNLTSMPFRRRPSSRASAPPGQTPEDYVSPPPAITSRRKISKLIENSTLSASEAKALREDGWSCCICLEEKDDEEQLQPITRLKCNHATHSECLRLWLETGRAACCLCNADVFSDGTKEPSLSSRASSTSGGDAGLIGSLIVERTDRTPSSPGTSVFIDVSQAYSDTAPSNDERDGDIESGV